MSREDGFSILCDEHLGLISDDEWELFANSADVSTGLEIGVYCATVDCFCDTWK